MYPGAFKDGRINFDSPDFDKMIDRISEIVNEEVYKWPESDISYMEEVDDSILTTITKEGQITILDNAIDFKETVKLLSELYLAVRRIGLLRLEDIINDNNTTPIVMRDFITNMVERIVDGTDPDEIARWSLEEYDNIQEQDEYKKLALSFSYQALRKLQGGESLKSLKVLCWKYVPTNIRFEVDTVIEKVKDKYE